MIKSKSLYTYDISSFGISIPIFSKILDVIFIDMSSGPTNGQRRFSGNIEVIYQEGDESYRGEKNVVFTIRDNGNYSGYKYLKTIIEKDPQLISSSSGNTTISFSMLYNTNRYYVFYYDSCLEEERDEKIGKIIE